jgi:prephenate dehydrogenase
MQDEDKFSGTIAILGLGLIGGSLGLALLKRSPETRVVGWSRSPKTMLEALHRGAVTQIAETPQEAAAIADVVVLACPLENMMDLIQQIRPVLTPKAVVTDVGSAKAKLVKDASALLGGQFIGGHPMAGSEESGIQAADPDLFIDAVWALTPTEQTNAAALKSVARIAFTVGATVYHIDPTEHDRYVASYSHLPHILAYGLAQTASSLVPDGIKIAAGSFRDGTRVAASSPSLWSGILMENADASIEAVEQFTKWLGKLHQAMQKGNREEVDQLLSSASEAKLSFKRKQE